MTPDRSTWPAALQARPVCPKRLLPIPFIAEVDEATGEGYFTKLDTKRAIECMTNRLCAMCSEPMDGDVALIGDVMSLVPESYFIEPPVHERCGEIALGGLCPFLHRERVPRRPLDDDRAPVGITPDALADIGRGTGKRPPVMAVCAGYKVGIVEAVNGSEAIAYMPDGVLRVRRFAYVADRLTEVVHPLAADPPKPLSAAERARWKAARRQPRRRPRSKR